MAGHNNQCKDGVCEIVLTFDDGPHDDTTLKLLDYLKQYDIKVFFFVVGKKLANEPGLSIIRRAYEEGHIIGNHSFNHTNLAKLTKSQIRDEIVRAHEIISKYTSTCEYFRPPYGSTNRAVKQVLDELGYYQVFWNIDTMDWKYKNRGYWVDYAMKQLKYNARNIILMHDNYSTTVDNLPNFIARINTIKNKHLSINLYNDKL